MTWAGLVPPGRRHWWAVGVVLLLTAMGCLAVDLRGHEDALAGTAAPQFASASAALGALPAPSAAGGTAPAPSGAALGPAVAHSTPVALRIPAIDVAVSVSELGLNPDKTVEVPTDFQQPGWFRLGPSPGQVGSAVILGHVDSYEGPAVFFRLRSLQEGDRVEVSLANGVVATFVVDGVATYPKEQFPAWQVYASHGYSGLQLVTCGGDFDTDSRSYESNVVAYTSLVEVTQPVTG